MLKINGQYNDMSDSCRVRVVESEAAILTGKTTDPILIVDSMHYAL